LALLQEEAGGHRDVNKLTTSHYTKVTKNAWPLPPPPQTEKTPTHLESTATSADSKLSAVKTYRKAMGLCYKCGVKWSKDHKCSPEVLHAIHDIWDTLSIDDASTIVESALVQTEQIFLALSKTAVNGVLAPKKSSSGEH
jgi:hypothetical protein